MKETRLYALPLLLSLSLGNVSAATLRNKVKGALVGAALGDTMGRVTEPFSLSDIKQLYGSDGLNSLQHITPCDLLYEPFKHKQAAYSTHSVFAHLVYETALAMRASNGSPEDFTDVLARKIIDQFGPHKYALDRHFEFRRHTDDIRALAEKLADAYRKNTKKLWWVDAKRHDQLTAAAEADSATLARAWPLGLVFADDIQKLIVTTGFQTMLTHRSPEAQAASCSLAVGMALTLRGTSVDETVFQMIEVAKKYESAEQAYRSDDKLLESTLVEEVYETNSFIEYANKEISQCKNTSQLLSYAYKAAKEGRHPDDLLGSNTIRLDSNRSPEGYLLGYRADEALAAALYIFVRHPDDIEAALSEAVNCSGRSSLIATIVGALVGGRCGYDHIEQAYGRDLTLLENREMYDGFMQDFENQKILQHKETLSVQKRLSALKLMMGTGFVGVIGMLAYLAYAHWYF